ncbi:MAG: hypothetical protein N3723_00550 [Candidatus Phytoplasma australiense]|nr:hypothetical protein [Candidatus Phytoplasma australiense]
MVIEKIDDYFQKLLFAIIVAFCFGVSFLPPCNFNLSLDFIICLQ